VDSLHHVDEVVVEHPAPARVDLEHQPDMV
jgi:hypothetical protein